MPCRNHDLLEVERAVPEGGVGLRGRRPERVVEPLREVDETHPLAAAARRRLEKDGKADLRGRCTDLRHRRRAVRAGDERHAGSPHLRLRGRFVAEPLHHLRRGTDEHEVVLPTRAREGGVLREEAVARVHGLAAGRLRRCYEVGNAQVALRRGRGPNADSLVGQLDVQRLPVGCRVDRDRLDSELVERADHPDGDLATVGHEDTGEHRRPAPRRRVDRRPARARRAACRTRLPARCRHGSIAPVPPHRPSAR